ncbi:MAG: hypothetical protein ACTHJ3_07580 [Pararhizobium sp.]
MTDLRPVKPISISDLTSVTPPIGEPAIESLNPTIGRSALDQKKATA